MRTRHLPLRSLHPAAPAAHQVGSPCTCLPACPGDCRASPQIFVAGTPTLYAPPSPASPAPCCRELQEQCCTLLAATVAHMLCQPPGQLAPLGSVLPALLSSLGESIEAECAARRPLDAPGARAMLALVQQLTTGAPQMAQGAAGRAEYEEYLRKVGSCFLLLRFGCWRALVAAVAGQGQGGRQLRFACPGLRRAYQARPCRVVAAATGGPAARRHPRAGAACHAGGGLPPGHHTLRATVAGEGGSRSQACSKQACRACKPGAALRPLRCLAASSFATFNCSLPTAHLR